MLLPCPSPPPPTPCRHFAKYLEEDIGADDLEDLYTKVHEAIRADPVHAKKARSKPADAKRWQPAKSTYEERKERLKVGGG
jgi:large subunit ribosomal protein L5e